jgi:hypothetical protein
MAETWTISVGGRSYGPYTSAQMQAFAAEGRLAPHSLIARSGENEYRPALDDVELAQLFQQQPAPTPVPVAAQPEERAGGSSSFGRQDKETVGERSHFIIAADMKSRSIAGLEEEIFNLGPAVQIVPQAWILSSDLSLAAIRSALVQKLGKIDLLFIADATHNKAAWFNFGPESEARIRRVWTRVPETIRKVG